MRGKISILLILAMAMMVPQASAQSNFRESAKNAEYETAILVGLIGGMVALPVMAAGAVVVYPIMLIAGMGDEANH